MNFTYEYGTTADGVKIKVTTYVPKPKLADTSQWPKFTVEWMGKRFDGVWLAPGCYILNGIKFTPEVIDGRTIGDIAQIIGEGA